MNFQHFPTTLLRELLRKRARTLLRVTASFTLKGAPNGYSSINPEGRF